MTIELVSRVAHFLEWHYSLHNRCEVLSRVLSRGFSVCAPGRRPGPKILVRLNSFRPRPKTGKENFGS